MHQHLVWHYHIIVSVNQKKTKSSRKCIFWRCARLYFQNINILKRVTVGGENISSFLEFHKNISRIQLFCPAFLFLLHQNNGHDFLPCINRLIRVISIYNLSLWFWKHFQFKWFKLVWLSGKYLSNWIQFDGSCLLLARGRNTFEVDT